MLWNSMLMPHGFLCGTEATPWKTAGSGDWSLCWLVWCHHVASGPALQLTYLVWDIWFILLRVFKAALPTLGISSLGEASLVPSSCSQSTSTRPSPCSNDDAIGSSCVFSLLGSSNSVIFTANTKSAIIHKPLAYRTTICAGMIFSEAAMALASVQSSGSSSSRCRSSSGLPPDFVTSSIMSCCISPTPLHVWINKLHPETCQVPVALNPCALQVSVDPQATNNYLNLNVTYITTLFVCCFVFAFGAGSVFPSEYFFHIVWWVFGHFSFKTSWIWWPWRPFPTSMILWLSWEVTRSIHSPSWEMDGMTWADEEQLGYKSNCLNSCTEFLLHT